MALKPLIIVSAVWLFLNTGLTSVVAQVVLPPEQLATEDSVADDLDSLQKPSSWKVASDGLVEEAMRSWLADIKADEPTVESTLAAFQSSSTNLGQPSSKIDHRLDHLVQAMSVVRPDITQFVDQLASQRQSVLPPTFSHILDNKSEHVFFGNHLRLFLGRWLVQNDFYDEALGVFSRLVPTDTVAPELILFYRSIAEHQLLKIEACQQSIETLLENEDQLPVRFSVVARLMLADIAPVKDGSLDQVSRLMKDVYRRTGLQRSGKVVLATEQQVIEKLDLLIQMAEQRQQQQQQAQDQQQSPSPGGQPAEESHSGAGAGDGKVRNKKVEDGGQWGDLPPAQRAAAMAEMAKDMPPHYRRAIEQYLRRLAQEGSQ